MSDENMKIWNAVCETDPAMTKTVDQKGGFTAICAQWQIQQATKLFGAVGLGWGYSVTYHELVGQNQVIQFADVTIWYEDEKNTFGPIRGCCQLVNSKGYVDTDAPKKAMTDALTKALSHLGFSADVFMGKFDDNKYVADMEKKFNGKDDKPIAKPAVKIDDLKAHLEWIKSFKSAEDVIQKITETKAMTNEASTYIKEQFPSAQPQQEQETPLQEEDPPMEDPPTEGDMIF